MITGTAAEIKKKKDEGGDRVRKGEEVRIKD